jgi:hypothetical protein
VKIWDSKLGEMRKIKKRSHVDYFFGAGLTTTWD